MGTHTYIYLVPGIFSHSRVVGSNPGCFCVNVSLSKTPNPLAAARRSTGSNAEDSAFRCLTTCTLCNNKQVESSSSIFFRCNPSTETWGGKDFRKDAKSVMLAYDDSHSNVININDNIYSSNSCQQGHGRRREQGPDRTMIRGNL